jgi:energy-coupling factor transport system permease protein
MSVAAAAADQILGFGYRARGGVLQQARATSAVWWCAAVGLVIVLFMNPLVLAAVLAICCLMAWRCGVLGDVLLALALTAPIAALIAIVNPIASQQGVTVIAAGLHLPLIGTFDITQEAVVYGLVLALRSVAVFALLALYICTVSPDDLLRTLRRYAVRSAITASLAVRFVPMLARDGAGLAEARACRPGDPPRTALVVRAAFARSLERAGDSAMALETRGYELARPLKVAPPPRGRADLALLASAAATAIASIAGIASGLAGFNPYPLTEISTEPKDVAFAFTVALIALAPGLLERQAAK